MKNAFAGLSTYLPTRLAALISCLPGELSEKATEIRLRLNSPLSISVGSKNLFIDSFGRVCKQQEAVCVTRDEIQECMSLLSRSSLYSFEARINKGYIPIKCLGRAGVCGEATFEGDSITAFKSINSINLRVNRYIKDFGRALAEYYAANGICGTLIYAPPALGKTTLLRSISALLGEGSYTRPYRVAIVDERDEIFIDGMNGGLIDVISGCSKSVGIELMCRTMSPEIIVCDELSQSESAAVINAQNTGVFLIATAHGDSLEGVMRRSFIAEMAAKRIFTIAVGLYRVNNSYSYSIEKI